MRQENRGRDRPEAGEQKQENHKRSSPEHREVKILAIPLHTPSIAPLRERYSPPLMIFSNRFILFSPSFRDPEGWSPAHHPLFIFEDPDRFPGSFWSRRPDKPAPCGRLPFHILMPMRIVLPMMARARTRPPKTMATMKTLFMQSPPPRMVRPSCRPLFP